MYDLTDYSITTCLIPGCTVNAIVLQTLPNAKCVSSKNKMVTCEHDFNI